MTAAQQQARAAQAWKNTRKGEKNRATERAGLHSAPHAPPLQPHPAPSIRLHHKMQEGAPGPPGAPPPAPSSARRTAVAGKRPARRPALCGPALGMTPGVSQRQMGTLTARLAKNAHQSGGSRTALGNAGCAGAGGEEERVGAHDVCSDMQAVGAQVASSSTAQGAWIQPLSMTLDLTKAGCGVAGGEQQHGPGGLDAAVGSPRSVPPRARHPEGRHLVLRHHSVRAGAAAPAPCPAVTVINLINVSLQQISSLDVNKPMRGNVMTLSGIFGGENQQRGFGVLLGGRCCPSLARIQAGSRKCSSA